MGLGDLIHTQSVYAHALMGFPPACSLTHAALKTAQAAKRPLPIFPLPRHLSQEKTVLEDIFRTSGSIFLAEGIVWAEISLSYSHMALSAAVSFHGRVQMVLCEACSEDWPKSHDSSLLFDQLVLLQTLLSFKSILSEGGHMLLSNKTDRGFSFWRWMGSFQHAYTLIKSIVCEACEAWYIVFVFG